MTKTYFNPNAGAYTIGRSALSNSKDALDRLVQSEQRVAEINKGDSLVTVVMRLDWSGAIAIVLALILVQVVTG